MFAGLRGQKTHPVGDAQVGRQSHQRVGGGQAASRRTSDDEHAYSGQEGGGTQQHVGRFERLDASDERDNALRRRQSQIRHRQIQCGAGRSPFTRSENIQIDARMHDVDTVRIGVVQRNQLVRFLFGVDNQPVGLVHHLLFADGAQRRLGSVTVSESGVLDRGQGVGGVHQWHRPAISGQPAHLTGQPVVRVHHVVVARLMVGLGAQHAGGERTQLGGEVVFVETFERTRDHVAHRHSGGHRDHRGFGRGGCPGEDLDLHAAAGHPQRGL